MTSSALPTAAVTNGSRGSHLIRDLDFNPTRTTVMTHTHANNQGQRSVSEYVSTIYLKICTNVLLFCKYEMNCTQFSSSVISSLQISIIIALTRVTNAGGVG